MKKKYLCLFVCLLLLSVAQIGFAKNNEASMTDIELLKEVTHYINHDSFIINHTGLKDFFFPLLGLGKNGQVKQLTFGCNTEGRWFSFLIQYTSHSGKTTGLFDLTFYNQRYKRSCEGDLIFFGASTGSTYGKVPKDRTGVISIYDIGRGDYLVNDLNGRVVNSLALPESLVWSPNHTTGHLINSGKTVGAILEERLKALEDAGEGGSEYSKRAAQSELLNNINKHRVIIDFE